MAIAGDTLGRRQALQAGAALLATHAACRDETPGLGRDGSAMDKDEGAGPDAHMHVAEASADVRRDRGAPDVTVVDGGGCAQSARTRAVPIAGEGIAMPGSAIAFFDDRYLDPVCSGSRILLIHPLTKTAYVALSGVCTHLCCDFTGGEGGPAYLTRYPLEDGSVREDVIRCSCHGSLFSALDGSVLSGPGGNPLASGLEVLPTCEGGGFVFVSIPQRAS